MLNVKKLKILILNKFIFKMLDLKFVCCRPRNESCSNLLAPILELQTKSVFNLCKNFQKIFIVLNFKI